MTARNTSGCRPICGSAASAKGEDGDRDWALLSVGAPTPPLAISADRLRAYAKRAGDKGQHRTAMIAAALSALGRLPLADAKSIAQDAGTPLGGQAAYADALQKAVRNDSKGGVVLLVATGMQTPGWEGVPAGDFYHMLAALRAVGLEPEARMIAAEAVSRL